MEKIVKIKTKRAATAAFLSIFSFVLCYIVGGSIKVGLFFAVFLLFVGIIDFKHIFLNKSKSLFILICFMASSFFTLFLSQLIQNERLFTLSYKRIFLGCICCIVPMLALFIITLKIRFSTFLISFLLLMLSTANYFVYNFRGSELCPADFTSIATALNVAGQYKYVLSNPLIYAWLFYAGFILFIAGLPVIKIENSIVYRIGTLMAIFCLCFSFSIFDQDIYAQHFLHGGSFINGYILNFTKEIPETFVQKPKGYSPEEVMHLSEKYAKGNEYEIKKTPDIIVIMDESFSDLGVLGSEINTNIPVTPFIDSIRENASFGYTLTSAYGGGTPNSEYEFLSGNTLLFVNGIVFQQYIHEPSYSLVSSLHKYGYYCIAMHPYLTNGWRRNTVWPNLLFDECMFLEHFPEEKLIRELVSDQEMFEVLLDTYKTKKKTSKSPIFIFGVTMQNHSSYDYEGADFQNSIFLKGYKNDYPDVEQYLSLIHETDKATLYLLDQLEKVEDDVVVLFYGDHQPALDERFLKEIHGGEFITLDEQQLLQMVPFFIWTNYKSEEEEIAVTSLNYLSNRLLQKAGLPLPKYNRFLGDIEYQIPAMNKKGYYSKKTKGFKRLSDADGKEKELLDQYWIAEYNSLFDLKNLNKFFFPICLNKES